MELRVRPGWGFQPKRCGGLRPSHRTPYMRVAVACAPALVASPLRGLAELLEALFEVGRGEGFEAAGGEGLAGEGGEDRAWMTAWRRALDHRAAGLGRRGSRPWRRGRYRRRRWDRRRFPTARRCSGRCGARALAIGDRGLWMEVDGGCRRIAFRSTHLRSSIMLRDLVEWILRKRRTAWRRIRRV